MLVIGLLASCDRSTKQSQEVRAPEGSAAVAPRAPAPAPLPQDAAMPTPSAAELTTRLTRDGARYALDVTIVNRLDQPIYVVDQLLISKPGNKLARTDAVTVMNDDDPGVVKLALAAISADEPSTVLYPLTYARVGAGETHHRVLSLPAPFAAWHPVAGVMPIAASARSAVFLTEYFVGEPPRWNTLPSDDAQPLKVPEGHTPELLRSAPMPIPGA